MVKEKYIYDKVSDRFGIYSRMTNTSFLTKYVGNFVPENNSLIKVHTYQKNSVYLKLWELIDKLLCISRARTYICNYSGFSDFWRRFGGGGGAAWSDPLTDALKSSELIPFGIRILLIFILFTRDGVERWLSPPLGSLPCENDAKTVGINQPT